MGRGITAIHPPLVFSSLQFGKDAGTLVDYAVSDVK